MCLDAPSNSADYDVFLLTSSKMFVRKSIRQAMRLRLLFPCFFLAFSALGQAPSGEIERARAVLQDGFNSGDFTVRVQVIQAVGLVGQN